MVKSVSWHMWDNHNFKSGHYVFKSQKVDIELPGEPTRSVYQFSRRTLRGIHKFDSAPLRRRFRSSLEPWQFLRRNQPKTLLDREMITNHFSFERYNAEFDVNHRQALADLIETEGVEFVNKLFLRKDIMSQNRTIDGKTILVAMLEVYSFRNLDQSTSHAVADLIGRIRRVFQRNEPKCLRGYIEGIYFALSHYESSSDDLEFNMGFQKSKTKSKDETGCDIWIQREEEMIIDRYEHKNKTIHEYKIFRKLDGAGSPKLERFKTQCWAYGHRLLEHPDEKIHYHFAGKISPAVLKMMCEIFSELRIENRVRVSIYDLNDLAVPDCELTLGNYQMMEMFCG